MDALTLSFTSSHRAQLVATALVSGVLGGSILLGLQAAQRIHKVEDLKSSIPRLGQEHHADKVS